MDFLFFFISILFFLFLMVAYLFKVLRLSIPLVLIYLVFCFSHIVNQDLKEDTNLVAVSSNYSKNKFFKQEAASNERLKSQKPVINNKSRNKSNLNSKPIVSLNPKPIIIDSNTLIQRGNDKRKIFNKSAVLIDPKLVNEKKDTDYSSIKLKDIMICQSVYKRNPVRPGFEFTNNVDSLFCYTKISNSGEKKEIKHIWYYKDEKITSVVYNIKTSYNYRSWSRKTILPNQIGKWRVDIVDDKENVLGSSEFSISLLNDAY